MAKIDKIASTRAPYSGVMFPSNIVPEGDDAQTKWAMDWTDAIVNSSQWNNYPRLNQNYALAMGNLNGDDFAHITQLYTNSTVRNQTLPAKLRAINVIDPLIRRIIGRVEAEGLQFSARVVNEDAVAQKLEDLAAEVAKKLTRYIRQQSGVTEILGTPVEEGDDVEPVIPSQVEDITMATYQQQCEIQITRALTWLLQKQPNNLQYKLMEQCFRNYLISGIMAVDSIIENDPDLYVVNPMNLVYDLYSSSPFIHHGRFAGYWCGASPQEVIARYPALTPVEVEKIDMLFRTFQRNGMTQEIAPFCYWDKGQNVLVLNVWKVYWKAVKKVRVKCSPNRFDADNPHIHFLKKGETANESKGEWIEERYVNTVWECTKLGGEIYYQCRELPNQNVPQDEPNHRELPIVGVVDPNPCFVDIVKHLQELRIEAFYTIERLMGQAKGKILIVDEAMDEDPFNNLYSMMAYSVYRINTAREGDQQLGMAGARPMEPKEVDLGLSQAVTDLMRLIAFIDQNLMQVTGINEPAQGIVKSDQGLGVTQAALQQSQLTIQPYYYVWYTTVGMMLQSLVNNMRPAWSGKEKTAYFAGDDGDTFWSLRPGDNWDMNDYGVTLVNSVGATKAREMMVSMASQILPIAKDPELALSVIKMVRAKTDAQAEVIFEKGIEAMRKIRQEEAQMAMEAQAQQSQAVQMQVAQKQEEANVPIMVAQIKEQGALQRQREKLGHKEDEQTVKFRNNLAQKAAETELNVQAQQAMERTNQQPPQE